MLTGFADELSADEVKAAGVRLLLKKPATVRDLAGAVQELLTTRMPAIGAQLDLPNVVTASLS
jgi:hypothetical protein